MPTWLQFVLGALTVYRIAVLITRDTFPFGTPRDWLTRRYTGDIVELFHCIWCVSLYVGALLWVLNLFFWPDTWLVGFETVLAMSAVAGYLGERS